MRDPLDLGDTPFNLWYRFPASFRPHLNPNNGDPFVAAFLPAAMLLGEVLEIEATISPRLRETLPQIQAIYRRWSDTLQPTRVIASPRAVRVPLEEPRAGRGLFFSLGVDSMYCLFKNLQIAPPNERVTHLLHSTRLRCASVGARALSRDTGEVGACRN